MSIQNREIWDILQIDEGADKKEIKKAYARLSREVHPEEKPEEFQRLYEAYQKALRCASCGEWPEADLRTDNKTEREEAPEKREESRYKELGLDSGEASEHQGRYDKMEEIAFFRHWWGKQMPAWLQKESLLEEEGAAYLRSESFRGIMWSPAVLNIIAEGMGKYFLRRERVLLFFWDLYGFEEAGEVRCGEEGSLLYRKLYPAYTNRIKRQQYAENFEEIHRDEHRRIRKKIVIGVCVVIGMMLTILALAYFEMLDMVASIFLGAAILAMMCWMFIRLIRWLFSFS